MSCRRTGELAVSTQMASQNHSSDDGIRVGNFGQSRPLFILDEHGHHRRGAAELHRQDLRAALSSHPLNLGLSPDLPLVLVDAQLLHHCLINLIDNAAKYSPEGCPILISADRRPDGIRLNVIDRGSGLPPGEEARIFETFARLAGSDRTGGTGLGLAIVRGFAEAMGLSAANRDDDVQGAIFTLHFPESRVVRERAEP